MKTIIKTDKAPAPVGTYNQGIAVNSSRLVFTAGQISIDPSTNEVIKGDIRSQTRLALQNIQQIFLAAGTNLDNTVKLTVFMTDLQNFSVVNEVFSEFFPDNPPARSALEVSALPKGVDIEIEGIAYIPD